MKTLLNLLAFLTIITLFLSCKKESSFQEFSLPKSNDVNEVIETVIYSNNLPVIKNNKTPHPYPLSVNLRKLEIKTMQKSNSVPFPLTTNEKYIEDFLLFHFKGVKGYTKIDSSYIQFQNKNFRSFKIDTAQMTNIMVINFYEKEKLISAFYDLTIPIFSYDNKKAYVEVTKNCTGCGGAYSVFLEKRNKKWVIINKMPLWMN